MEDLITQFEQCTLPQTSWHHRQHLLVALHYVQHEPEQAEQRMQEGIQRLNAAHGVPQTETGGYHDTLTIAWVRHLKGRLRAGASPDEILAEDPTAAIGRYYSRERIMSWEARTGWVEPDLAPLPAEGDPP